MRHEPIDEITFSVTPNRKSYTKLHLHNISDDTLAYKVKTTNIKSYCVRPNAALLAPGEEIDVELIQQAYKSIPEDFFRSRDRFLLQIARLVEVPRGPGEGSLHGYATAMDLWTKVPDNVIYKSKFETKNIVVPESTPLTAAQAADDTTSIPSVLTQPQVKPNTMMQERKLPPTPTLNNPTIEAPPLVNDLPDVQMEEAPLPPLPSRSVPPPPPPAKQYESVSRAPKSQSPKKEPPQLPSETEPRAAPVPVSPVVPQKAAPDPRPTALPPTSETPDEPEIDYQSIEFARERALGMQTAPKISLDTPDAATKQRIAVERAGELVRVINIRLSDIEVINEELAEARHKLSDARMATRPAYDVRYEVNESSRVSLAQVAIMAVISGALLQLLV